MSCELPGAGDLRAAERLSVHGGVSAVRAGGFGEDQQEEIKGPVRFSDSMKSNEAKGYS